MEIAPGQLVAVVGPSGGGKSTLLESLAGLRPLAGGRFASTTSTFTPSSIVVRSQIGFVPQDDIIHRELPLGVTLRHAAQAASRGCVSTMRPSSVRCSPISISTDQAPVPVGSLSGGQRKRASIAVELLARPRLLILDEPTAGLDPTTATGLVRSLRRLADSGCTVILTTHNTQDLTASDVVAVGRRTDASCTGATAAGALGHLGVRGRRTTSPRPAGGTPGRAPGTARRPQPRNRDRPVAGLTRAQRRAPRPQPADGRDHARSSRARHRDVRRALHPWCLRRCRGPVEPTDHGRLLVGVRRVLLRTDLRPAPGGHRSAPSPGGSDLPACESGPTWRRRSQFSCRSCSLSTS